VNENNNLKLAETTIRKGLRQNEENITRKLPVQLPLSQIRKNIIFSFSFYLVQNQRRAEEVLLGRRGLILVGGRRGKVEGDYGAKNVYKYE
jgi:hypothetical protein